MHGEALNNQEKEFTFSDKRKIVEVLKSDEISNEQLQFIREKTGLENIESVSVEDIESAKIRGLKIELDSHNNYSSKELFKALLNPTIPDGVESTNWGEKYNQWYDRVFKNFDFVEIDNLNLKIDTMGGGEPVKTADYEQAFHHDGGFNPGVPKDSDVVIALYHRALADGEIPRQANTMISNAKMYHNEQFDFLMKWFIETENLDGLDDKTKELYKQIEYILINPEKDPSFEETYGYNKEKSLQKALRELATSDDAIKGRIIHLAESHGALRPGPNSIQNEFQLQYRPKTHMFKWKPKTLLIFNNATTVHGLGPRPEGAISEKEVPLINIPIGRLYNKH